jgi:transcriptional regulator with XRE-family HTH domain
MGNFEKFDNRLEVFEFIVETFGLKFKEVAEYLEISPKTVNDWVKGRSNIPEKHLVKLADKFGIKKELITKKKLSRVDEIRILITYLERNNEKVEYSTTIIGNDGKEYSTTNHHYSNDLEINFLHKELEIAEKVEELTSSIESFVRLAVQESDEETSNIEVECIENLVSLLCEKDSKRISMASKLISFLQHFYNEEESKWQDINPFLSSEDFTMFKELKQQLDKIQLD